MQTASTRDRILDTTAEHFRRYGYTGTGLKQIVADAHAPFGSIYHFFPGGKEQLGREVILRSGRMYQELIETIFDSAPDIFTGVRNIFSGAAELLVATDYADACPIATVALEVASANETLRQATSEVFENWLESGTERFMRAGLFEAKAREIATRLVMNIEGAFLLCRATKTTDAMEIAGAATVEALELALAGRA